ncbi:MAG: hypothetical protein AAGD86_05995, partial [Pseudomonadota bacterium]
ADTPEAASGALASIESVSERHAAMLERKLIKWTENPDLVDGEAPVHWRHRGRSFTAEFERVPAEDDTGLDELMVTVRTTDDGESLVTRVRMRRLAFSNFAQFVDRWNPNVQMHDDEFEGRVHSNTSMNIQSTRDAAPTFHGKVTTTARRMQISTEGASFRRDEAFLGGIETGVRRIKLPKHYVPFPGGGDAEPEAQEVIQLVGNTRVRFEPDGSYRITPLDGGGPGRVGRLGKRTVYLLGSPKHSIYLSGTVDGRVLVYSPQRIVLEGSLLFAHDPVLNPDGDDFIGLVSDRTVEVATPEVTGPGDVRIDASIYAKRRFLVQRYRAPGTALLHVYGSLSAGTLSATEPRYRTRIEFDPRLEHMRAPGFPMTDRFEITDWDGQWYEEPAAAPAEL